MTTLLLALVVGVLFATGTYMIMRRGQIKLILGLGLLSHGINLLLFGSGPLVRGNPPIFLDKARVMEDLAGGMSQTDPLPQALILTAIVISFGITAFVILLVNRRHTVAHTDVLHGELVSVVNNSDPFYLPDGDNEDESITRWLSYRIDSVEAQSLKRFDAAGQSEERPKNQPDSDQPDSADQSDKEGEG